MNTWAVVELMGHQRALGQIEEVTVAGAGFLQITTPGPNVDDEPKAVRIVSPSAIYAINPTTEEAVRARLYPPARAELERETGVDYCGGCGEELEDCTCDEDNGDASGW